MKVVKTQRNSKNCIICGMDNPFGLKAVFHELDNSSVGAVVSFDNLHQSYPDRTHGGMVSALLDEIIGRALWITEPQTFGVTTTLTITYRRPVPPTQKIKARGYLTFNSARGFRGKGELYDLDGNLLAEGEAKYFKIPLDKAFSGGGSFHEEMCYVMPKEYDEIDFPPITE